MMQVELAAARVSSKDVDVAVRHPESFSASDEVVTA
jgi:hypothetical protein